MLQSRIVLQDYISKTCRLLLWFRRKHNNSPFLLYGSSSALDLVGLEKLELIAKATFSLFYLWKRCLPIWFQPSHASNKFLTHSCVKHEGLVRGSQSHTTELIVFYMHYYSITSSYSSLKLTTVYNMQHYRPALF